MPKPEPDDNFYQMLKLSPDATASELEGRIRTQLAQARRLVGHPEQGAKATALIQQLRSARQVLLDPLQRSQYDALQRRRQRQLPLAAALRVLERWLKFARPDNWRFNPRHRWQADAGRQLKTLGLRFSSFVGRLTGKT